MEIENNKPERQETMDLKLKGDPVDLTGFKEAIYGFQPWVGSRNQHSVS